MGELAWILAGRGLKPVTVVFQSGKIQVFDVGQLDE
jgi:hypothetical protein